MAACERCLFLCWDSKYRGERDNFFHFQYNLLSEIVTGPQQSCAPNHVLSPTPKLALAVTLSYVWLSDLVIVTHWAVSKGIHFLFGIARAGAMWEELLSLVGWIIRMKLMLFLLHCWHKAEMRRWRKCVSLELAWWWHETMQSLVKVKLKVELCDSNGFIGIEFCYDISQQVLEKSGGLLCHIWITEYSCQLCGLFKLHQL